MTDGTGRRRFMRNGFRVAAACMCLPLFDALTGCADDTEPPQAAEPLVVPLALLPLGERRHVEHRGHPVELLRTEHGVTARSLICTHQGCTVAWHEDRQVYICPCHEGKFNADGDVVYGMPRGPLKVFDVTVAEGQATVRL